MAPTNPKHRVRTNSDPISRLSPFLSRARAPVNGFLDRHPTSPRVQGPGLRDGGRPHNELPPPPLHEDHKSVGAALVLTFLFGPLGLLYSSVIGGLLLIVVGGVVFVATLGLAGLIIWPLSMVWGAVAASNQHSKYQAWLAQMRQMPAGPAAPPVPPRP
jgi:hypothetical protein